MNLEENVGDMDSKVRLVLGILAGIAGLSGLFNLINLHQVISGILVLVGVILIFTGTTKSCMLYKAIGTSTN